MFPPEGPQAEGDSHGVAGRGRGDGSACACFSYPFDVVCFGLCGEVGALGSPRPCSRFSPWVLKTLGMLMASLPGSLRSHSRRLVIWKAVCGPQTHLLWAFARAVPSAWALAPPFYPPLSPVYSSAPSVGATSSRKPSLLPDFMCYEPISRGALVAKDSGVYGLGLALWIWF